VRRKDRGIYHAKYYCGGSAWEGLGGVLGEK